ncbi:MAG TPA: glycosyltransferase [Methylibium sp.]|uniref:glycosyltransferase n=1 Tax=Methylibium sp. TaxID=2067992 RepID=UPI002DBD1501|nr:glycosyltransferase [Methylibium sp.]HEU4460732.1 glycosyltransferase [Methylibium sp.]
MTMPNVRVLLATHNGASWLNEQLRSIVQQQGVRVFVVASDDSSTDGTPQLLAQWEKQKSLSMMPTAGTRFGNAHRNFLRLIRDAELSDAEYFALSDQDDIWLPGKLARGIECLRSHAAHGYSSNVTAFWPDGTQLLIDKAQPQRRFDHLFGSPGPGCTFVLPRGVFEDLRAFVTQNFERIQSIWVHDWLIYAFVRCRGGRWHIDDRPCMLYRQHGRNEIGVNAGWKAALNRLNHVRSGAYRRDILAIADSVGESAEVVEAVRRLRLRDRLHLTLGVRQFRRRLWDGLVLALFFLVMPRA